MPIAGQIIRASDIPRVQAFATLTANSADVTAETAVFSVGSASYQTGRAYRATIKCLVQTSANTCAPEVKVRRGTGTSGSTVLATFAIYCHSSADNYPVFYQTYFTPASNFTDAFTATILRNTSAAAETTRMVASATDYIGYLLIEDMGEDSLDSFPGILDI